jgi:hypothetical protein
MGIFVINDAKPPTLTLSNTIDRLYLEQEDAHQDPL